MSLLVCRTALLYISLTLTISTTSYSDTILPFTTYCCFYVSRLKSTVRGAFSLSRISTHPPHLHSDVPLRHSKGLIILTLMVV